jgi:Cysteine rich repeat
MGARDRPKRAVRIVATECRRELDTYCANVEVGDGRVAQCLKDHATISAPRATGR